LGEKTYLTFADGGTFSKFSEEFQTISEAGEDNIYIDREKNFALNEEVLNEEVLNELNLKRENLIQEKAIEVGNIFTLKDKFSKPLGLTYKDREGKENSVFMGSYGIGISRLMGTIVEVLADEKGIV
jgi:prolyl-tRNA synthetase